MTKIRADNLTRVLREHPRAGSSELCVRLGGINRATLMRALKTLGDAVVVGGETRRTRYALRRALRGSIAPMPFYRIDEANNDMHEGNLAFRPGLSLAPVYDMLPMAYAPMRGGELPRRDFHPSLPLPAEADAWKQAATAAIGFWESGSEDVRISDDFRRICDENRRILEELRDRAR